MKIGTCVEWNPALADVAHFPSLKRCLPLRKDGSLIQGQFFQVTNERKRKVKYGETLRIVTEIQVDTIPGQWFSPDLFVRCSEDIQMLFGVDLSA